MIVKTYEEIFGEKLTIRDLINGFEENTKTGEVVAFNGNLNVRPPYQRGFVYELPKQIAVIETILKEYPLNVMYWAKSDDGKYELMDGQQRTLSICLSLSGMILRKLHLRRLTVKIMHSRLLRIPEHYTKSVFHLIPIQGNS